MAFTDRTMSLARAAVTAAGRVINTIVRTLTAAWARAWKGLAAAFTTAVQALLADRDNSRLTRRDLTRDPLLRQALDSAGRRLDALARLTAAEASAAARTAAETSAQGQADIIASQLPDTRALPTPGRFHDQAIAAIIRRAQERIIKLTRPLSTDAQNAMRTELIRGVRVGANPAESARRMVGRVEGAFNGGLTRAMTIARTEVLDAYREAARAAQHAHSDVVGGWVWLAALQPDTCAACWAMHGTEHPTSEPGPLGHPNCRCSRAPKTKSWTALGFPELDEDDDLIPDAETIFRALPRADQLRIMGRARLALLDAEKITWADLARRRDNPGWRPSYAPVPVRDLTRVG